MLAIYLFFFLKYKVEHIFEVWLVANTLLSIQNIKYNIYLLPIYIFLFKI